MPSDTMRATSQQPNTQHGTSLSPSVAFKPWDYNEVFGIVHREGCRTCRRYMIHISDPALQHSYTQALHQRDAEVRRQFVEGFRRGRSTQQEHDSERLKAYRAQRDEARTLEAVHKLKLDEANALVLQLRDELLALQIAYDELRSPTPPSWDDLGLSDNPEMSDAHSPPASDDEAPNAQTPDLWGHDDAGDSDIDSYDDDNESASTSDEEKLEEGLTVDPQTSDVWDNDDSDDYDEDSDVDSTESASTPSDEEEFELEAEIDIVEECDNELADGMDRIAAMNDLEPTLQLHFLSFATSGGDSDTDDHHVTFPLQSFSPQPSTSPLTLTPYAPTPPPGNYSLTGIREQMKLAHRPDKRETLVHIRSLVSEAHRTDPALRTEVQKTLLAEWRRPPPLHPQLGETIYVDASGLGIGFVFGNQWQAWRWTKTWKQEGRDIQWAEAVAVEMGIRLMIASGYSGRKIILYSDNRQVVDAISGERAIGELYATQIVHKVKCLCDKNKIQLEILWVPGEQNPADAPSRLNPVGGKNTRLPHQIDIPQHLQEFVLPWV